jgi:hypothetical protein
MRRPRNSSICTPSRRLRVDEAVASFPIVPLASDSPQTGFVDGQVSLGVFGIQVPLDKSSNSGSKPPATSSTFVSDVTPTRLSMRNSLMRLSGLVGALSLRPSVSDYLLTIFAARELYKQLAVDVPPRARTNLKGMTVLKAYCDWVL